jgi:hypothetical protein
MYAITYKDNVIIGIVEWNSRFFIDAIKQQCNVNVGIPTLPPDASQFPYFINDDLIIYPAEENRQGMVTNPLIHYYYGPTWEILQNKIIGHYELKNFDLETVKNNYKRKAAYYRYQKEIEGISFSLNGIDYNVTTDRESRIRYFEKLISMSEGAINWKFDDKWATLSKENIQSIISAVDLHVQSAFDYEYNLNVEIDLKQTVEELTLIEELNKTEYLDLKLNYELFAAHLL